MRKRFEKMKKLVQPNPKKKREQHETGSAGSARADLTVHRPSLTDERLDTVSKTTSEAKNSEPEKALGDLDHSKAAATHQLGSAPVELSRSPYPTPPSTMSMLQGATNFKIDNSTLNNIQGNATFIRLFGDGPFTETQMEFFKKHLSGLVTVQNPERSRRSIQKYCDNLCQSITALIEEEGFTIADALKDKLKNLCNELSRISAQASSDDGDFDIENANREVALTLESFAFACRMSGLVKISEAIKNQEKYELMRVIRELPRAEAAHDDYASKKRSGPCFEGTREALLTEIAEWIMWEFGVYILSGLAGIGKSTVAYTVAERAKSCGYLGASFFFSRDEADRKTAKKVFTTIAFQLCVYDKDFANAIGKALQEEHGSAAVTKDPRQQLKALIVDPLRDVAKSRIGPTVIVVDALDECEDGDAHTIVLALNELVQSLPSFKVILTTRPQPHLGFLFDGSNRFTIFHLHNIEEKVVDRDVQLYLEHNLSQNQVMTRLPTLREPWNASGEEVASLVSATGRLFIIASTAVFFILDRATCNPRKQMAKLLAAFSRHRTPLNALNNFYATVLRNAVPLDCDFDIVERFQVVMGTIVLIQEPIPVAALARLIDEQESDIYAVVDNLQAIILLSSNDTPLVYHKSMPDYIMDPMRCKDVNLHIDPKHHHTRMAICCLKVVNQHLKQNILDLEGHVRFMPNDKVLADHSETRGESHDKNNGGDSGDKLDIRFMTKDEVEAKIPLELRYACMYWAKHVEGANAEDRNLDTEIEIFFNEHLLHWFEALSWVGKLDSAHHVIRSVQKLKKSTLSDLQELILDGLRFISRFFKAIEHTALHIYQAALPFVPNETALYRRYCQQISFCRVQGAPGMWDALIANPVHDADNKSINFSLDSTMFASFGNKEMKLWDALTGTPMGTITGGGIAISASFSIAASFENDIIVFYDVQSTAPIATVKESRNVRGLALSPSGFQIVIIWEDGIVSLRDWKTGNQVVTDIGRKIRWEKGIGDADVCPDVAFSRSGARLAFPSDAGITLLDGTSGKLIRHLHSQSYVPSRFSFSDDSSRIATSNRHTVGLWNCETGELIGIVEDVGHCFAISADGSMLAAAMLYQLALWSAEMQLHRTHHTSLGDLLPSNLAFSSDGILALVSFYANTITLYDRQLSVVATLPTVYCQIIAFSPDGTRLVSADQSRIYLWEVPRTTNASDNTSPRQLEPPVVTLAFSHDCSRIAAGFENGIIKLWDTDDMQEPIATRKCPRSIVNLAFSHTGSRLASASDVGDVIVWDGELAESKGSLQLHSWPSALAISDDLIAIGLHKGVTLWDLQTFSSTEISKQVSHLLLFSHTGPLLAICCGQQMEVWDVGKQQKITTLNTSDLIYHSERAVFSDDNSQFATSTYGHELRLYDIPSNKATKLSEHQASQLRLIPCWSGTPVLLKSLFGDVIDNFYMRKKAYGSSMFAIDGEDGRVAIIRSLSDSIS